MSDDLTTLLHDSAQRVPTALHPAANVRRSAQHHQRVRRAGAAAASVAAVLVISLIALVPPHERRDAAPLPAATPTATTSETSAPPAGGLLTGFEFPEEPQWRSQASDSIVLERSRDVVDWRVAPCAKPLGDTATARQEMLTVQFSAPEEGQTRQLGVYGDSAAAGKAADDLRTAVEGCAGERPGEAHMGPSATLSWETRFAEIGDGGFLAWSRAEGDSPDAEGPNGSYALVASRGKVVYLASYSGAHFGPASPDDERMAQLVDGAKAAIPLIDRLLDRAGQAVRSSPTIAVEGGAPALAIPSSFRFAEEEQDSAWRTSHGENEIERSDDPTRKWVLQPCSPAPTTYASNTKRTSMRTLTRSGPEFADTLQLALYRDAATAKTALTEFTREMDKCRVTYADKDRYTRHVWARDLLDVGEAGLLAIGNYEIRADPGSTEYGATPGSEHVAVTQFGNALFLRLVSGEAFRPRGEADPTKEVVVASARANVEQLCRLVLQCEATP